MPAAPEKILAVLEALDVATAAGTAPTAPILLEVVYGEQKIGQPGDVLLKTVVEHAPTLSANLPENKTYLLLTLDLDAPYASFPFLSPLLHWLQSDLTLQASTTGTGPSALVSSADSPVITPYRGAGAPPLGVPHRYVFLLYEQPAGFEAEMFRQPEGREADLMPRFRFDFEGFERRAGVGEVVAANYFRAGF